MVLKRDQLGRTVDDKGIMNTHVDMVLYGASGAGKTFRAATAPQPMYVIGSDATGHKSIPFPVDGRVLHSIEDVGEVILDFLTGGHGYKTLLVDGLSFMHDMFVKETGQYMVDRMGAKDPDLMPIQGRMKILNRFSNMLRQLINLSQVDNIDDRVHVIFTTLEQRLKEDERAPFTIRPLFGTERMNASFPAFFSIISYIEPAGEVDDKGNISENRQMFFSTHNGVLARDRLGLFKPFYPSAPDLSDILY